MCRKCVILTRAPYLQSGLLRLLGRARCPGLATRPRPCAWRWSQRTVRFALSSWRVVVSGEDCAALFQLPAVGEEAVVVMS